MVILFLLLTVATASPTVSVVIVTYTAATAATVIYDGTSAWSIDLHKPTKTTITLYNLTPTLSASPTTASTTPTDLQSAFLSSLISSQTSPWVEPISTIIASPTNASNGSVSAPGLNTSADPKTSAVLTGAIIGGCLLGGLAIALFWFLWKRVLHKQQRPKSTNRNRLDNRRLKAVWSSATSRVQSSSTQTTLWDDIRDSFRDHEDPFRDSLAPSTVSESPTGDDIASGGGYQETAEVRSERLDRLFRRNHSPVRSPSYGFNGKSFGPISKNYPMDWLSRPRSATMVPLPPILKRTSIPEPLSAGRDLPISPSSAQMKPLKQDSARKLLNSPMRSPQKSPLRSPIKRNDNTSYQDSREELTSAMTSETKKGVRFGGEQIKEFGRTPYASTANSAMEDFDDRNMTV
ncbi:hypothetical protein MMC26_004750 [Xylographa opegraphella]|nr:hypothetical protein [Xylographa opegraphella]